MGIPSYFSYLLRKHPYIITALQPADNLYLDSNSIIYDMVSSMDTVDEVERQLAAAKPSAEAVKEAQDVMLGASDPRYGRPNTGEVVMARDILRLAGKP
jgi:hypothetical protein